MDEFEDINPPADLRGVADQANGITRLMFKWIWGTDRITAEILRQLVEKADGPGEAALKIHLYVKEHDPLRYDTGIYGLLLAWAQQTIEWPALAEAFRSQDHRWRSYWSVHDEVPTL
jgi:hypothetical protein